MGRQRIVWQCLAVCLSALLVICATTIRALISSPVEHPEEWQIFYGEGESQPEGWPLNELDTPSDMAIIGNNQILIITERGKILVLNYLVSGKAWKYSGSFSLNDRANKKQRYILKPDPKGRFLYVGRAGGIEVFEQQNNRWLSRPALGMAGLQVLDGLSAMEISHDGQHLFTLSRSRGNVCFYTINKDTGALEFQQVLWADGDGGIPELTGAHSLAVSPDNRELAVTGSWANAITFFRKTGSAPWQYQYSISRENQGPLESLHSPRGIVYSRDGQTLYVATYIAKGIMLFRKTGNLQVWQHHHLMIDESLDRLWLGGQGSQLFAAYQDGLISFAVGSDGTLKYHDFLGRLDSPGFTHVVSVVQPDSIASQVMIASQRHRLSIYQESAGNPIPPPRSHGVRTMPAVMGLLPVLLLSRYLPMP